MIASRHCFRVGLVGAVLALAGCDDLLLDDQTLQITAQGNVEGFAYFDTDGSQSQTGSDEPYAGLRLRLVTAAGGTVGTMFTDEEGQFVVPLVPVGAYRVALDEEHAPDSVHVFLEDDAEPFLVIPGATERVVIRVAFPLFTLAEVRALPPGERVITHGIALNPRNSFGDGVVHLQEGNVYLRATDVDRSGLSPGDSVRFVGITARDQGQPILTEVRPSILVDDAVLVGSVGLSTSAAATAVNGTLDAALVRIEDAAIVDTTSLGPHLLVTANDGSGPIEILLRDFVGFDRRRFVPNGATIRNGVGLLVPVQVAPGQTRWRMTPRFVGDMDVDD